MKKLIFLFILFIFWLYGLFSIPLICSIYIDYIYLNSRSFNNGLSFILFSFSLFYVYLILRNYSFKEMLENFIKRVVGESKFITVIKFLNLLILIFGIYWLFHKEIEHNKAFSIIKSPGKNTIICNTKNICNWHLKQYIQSTVDGGDFGGEIYSISDKNWFRDFYYYDRVNEYNLDYLRNGRYSKVCRVKFKYLSESNNEKLQTLTITIRNGTITKVFVDN